MRMIFSSSNSPSFFRLRNSAARICCDRRSRMRQDELAEYKKPQLASEAGVYWSGGGRRVPDQQRRAYSFCTVAASYKFVMAIDKASQM